MRAMRLGVLGVIVVGLAVARPARAQPATPSDLDGFLEQRVPEELAADGLLLAQHGVVLDVETIGARLLVTLVDPTTGAARASTRLDALPVDREAAVASVAHLVTSLIDAGLPPAPAPAPVEPSEPSAPLQPPGGTESDPDLAARRSAYEAEEIDFWVENKVHRNGGWSRTVQLAAPFVGRGTARRRLSDTEFFIAIGKPEIGTRIRRRSRIAKGLGIAFLVTTCAGFVVASRAEPEEWVSSTAFQAGAGMLAVGAGFGIAALIVRGGGNPYDVAQMRQLVDLHNARLRAKHRLPEPPAEPSAVLVPYVAPSGGGLALSGRF